MFCIRRCASRNYPRPCPTPPCARKEPLQPRHVLSDISTSRHAPFRIAHVLWHYRVAFNCYICDTHQAHASKKKDKVSREKSSVSYTLPRTGGSAAAAADPSGDSQCSLPAEHVDRKQCAAMEQLLRLRFAQRSQLPPWLGRAGAISVVGSSLKWAGISRGKDVFALRLMHKPMIMIKARIVRQTGCLLLWGVTLLVRSD